MLNPLPVLDKLLHVTYIILCQHRIEIACLINAIWNSKAVQFALLVTKGSSCYKIYF